LVEDGKDPRFEFEKNVFEVHYTEVRFNDREVRFIQYYTWGVREAIDDCTELFGSKWVHGMFMFRAYIRDVFEGKL
jgi:hypothetical protein